MIVVGWLRGLRRTVANRLGVLSRRSAGSNPAPTVFLDGEFWRWFEAYWCSRAGGLNAYAARKGEPGKVSWIALAQMWGDSDAKCCWCGCDIAMGTKRGRRELATIEHVVPLNCGGPNSIFNLDFACRPCNTSRRYHPREMSPYKIRRMLEEAA